MSPTFEQLSKGICGEELRVLQYCFTRRGTLKKSKPFTSRECFAGQLDAQFKGLVNYAWRMLCFDFLPCHPHCCMPVTADLDLAFSFPGTDRNGERLERDMLLSYLKDLIKRAESNLPLTAQAGTMRWGRALGYVQ